MADEKIKISLEEVTSVEVKDRPAQQTVYSTPRPSYTPTTSVKQEGHPFLLVAGIVGAIVVLGILFFVFKVGQKSKETPFHRQTVEEWCAQTEAELNNELAKYDCPVRKFIEDAHITVNVRQAKVVCLTAATLDGTDFSNGGRNIHSFRAQIKFIWDGIIQKDGYSILEIVYDCQNDKFVKSEIIETNAQFNTEDPNFWFGVGYLVGEILAL